MAASAMTSRQRLLTAMRGRTPDRVPVQAGMGQMIPAKRTGLPWWDIYLHNKVDLAPVRIETMKGFGLDAYCPARVRPAGRPADDRCEARHETIRDDGEYIVVRSTISTPGGELWMERTYPRADTPTTTRGLVKDAADMELYLDYFCPGPPEFDASDVATTRTLMGEDGIVSGTVGLPGLHNLTDLCDGKLETATYLWTDRPDLVEQYRLKREAETLAMVTALLDAGPDYIEVSASGALTLSTPGAFRDLCLPTLQKIARLCRQADTPCELHCCGKARLVVEMCVNETELHSINPLQPPPMGDCELAEVKRSFGDRICLKGNVGVTEPMLFGTVEDVERDVLRCLEAAKAGGGYILFTEEQLGRDTPDENIRRYVDVARAHGAY